MIFGNVAQPPEAANIARVIALNAGIPQEIPAYTVHRNCASGFEAITSAYEKMASGEGDTFIVGGTESMSNIPLLFSTSAADKFAALNRAKNLPQKLLAALRFRPSDFRPRIGVMMGLTDYLQLEHGPDGGSAVRDYGIPRENQDAFALESHRKLWRRARNYAKKS